jgi:hypothetical protein
VEGGVEGRGGGFGGVLNHVVWLQVIDLDALGSGVVECSGFIVSNATAVVRTIEMVVVVVVCGMQLIRRVCAGGARQYHGRDVPDELYVADGSVQQQYREYDAGERDGVFWVGGYGGAGG